MDQSKFEDERVKEILSGLEKIIVAISEFRKPELSNQVGKKVTAHL